MSYTSFAVAGAGPRMGARIVQALISQNVSVVVLARPDSTSISNPMLQGAKVVTVDFADSQAMSDILRDNKIEVLVCAISLPGIHAQTPLADAAKEAGVKLLVPSEFGMATEGCKEGFLSEKEHFADYVKGIGVPMMRVFCGLFMEAIPWLARVKYGQFHLVGDQNLPASFSAMDDVVGFTVHVLTSLPPSSLHNTTFRIQGERASLSAIGALYEAGDPPIPVVHVDKLPEGSERQTLAQDKFSRGHGSTGWDYYLGQDVPENADSGNKAWEGHRWKTIREVLDL